MEDLLFMKELRELLIEKNVIFSFSKVVHCNLSSIIISEKIEKKKCFLYLNFLRVYHIFRANIRDIAITRMITCDTYINRSELVSKSLKRAITPNILTLLG